MAFSEKPEVGKEIPGKPGHCYGSMGIYLFEANELVRRLCEDDELGDASSHDFGKDIIPRMIDDVPVYAHDFVDASGAEAPYWRDVGTIDAYYEANLDLCNVEPQFNLYDSAWSTYTLWHNDPPAKTVFNEDGGRKADVADSLLCPGVIVSGARVHRSILSNRVFVGENATVEDSILFSGVQVGEGARLKRTIVDKWIQIPAGEEIGFDRARDEQRFRVSESGVVVVPPGYRFDG